MTKTFCDICGKEIKGTIWCVEQETEQTNVCNYCLSILRNKEPNIKISALVQEQVIEDRKFSGQFANAPEILNNPTFYAIDYAERHFAEARKADKENNNGK